MELSHVSGIGGMVLHGKCRKWECGSGKGEFERASKLTFISSQLNLAQLSEEKLLY